MKMNLRILCLYLLILATVQVAVPLQAAAQNNHTMPYAGQHQRAIKALSEQDILELESGGGWGLAKAAELNGMPGPTHLLELKEQIGLSGRQILLIGEMFDQMKKQAIPLGIELVALERQLDEAFASGQVNAEILKQHLKAISNVQSQLRFVHLSAHLQTPKLLTPDQITSYKRLRGYGAVEPGHLHSGHQ